MAMTRGQITCCIMLSFVLTAGCKAGCSCGTGSVAEPGPLPSAKRQEALRKPDKEREEDEENEDEEAKEEAEKAELMKPHFWKVKVAIVGQGFVTSYDKAITCGNDGTHHGEECGPKEWNAPLAGYKPAPSMLTAIAPPGWQLAKWSAEVHHANGRVVPRKRTSIRDFYINYFREPYDANDFELVTATFKAIPDGGSTEPSKPAPSGAASGAPSGKPR